MPVTIELSHDELETMVDSLAMTIKAATEIRACALIASDIMRRQKLDAEIANQKAMHARLTVLVAN